MYKFLKNITFLLLLMFVVNNAKATDDVEAFVTNASTRNRADGAIRIQINNGYEPYTFNWSGPSINASNNTLQNQSGILAGVYYLTVTDDLCGTAKLTITVGYEMEIACFDNLTGTEPTVIHPCSNMSNGSIDLNVTPSRGILYRWSNNSTSSKITNLAAGDYCVTITQTYGDNCVEVRCFHLSSMLLTMSSDPACGDYGKAKVTVLGGTAPYNYQWDNGSREPMIYTGNEINCVTVRDANNCIQRECVWVRQNINVEITNVNHTSIPSACDGSIEIQATGDAAPFNFSWSNGENSPNISNLCAGAYDVTVTGRDGQCPTTLSVGINTCSDESFNGFLPMSVTPEVNWVSTVGQQNGSIRLIISGGSNSYVVKWTGPNGYIHIGNQFW